MSATRRNLIAVCLLLSFASLAFSGFLLLRRFAILPFDTQFMPQAQAEALPRETIPTQLVMPDQRIDLPVIPAQIQNQEWQLSNQGISLLQTALPANNSGLIMYGHNWRSLLGGLNNAKIGEKIHLIYADGNITQYTIHSILVVDPNRLDVLNLATPDTLLLYTCTGFLDSQRLVVLATK